MAKVTVDVPGIGPVDANNAATESTLRELVNAIKGMQGRAGGGGGSSGGDTKAQKAQTTATNNQTKAANAYTNSTNAGTAAASKLAGGFARFGNIIKGVGGMAVTLSEKIVDTVDKFANVGDSVESAAAMFSSIPVVGVAFAATAKAASQVVDSFQSAAESGATFGGSISAFSAAASGAGMTMAQFSQIVSQNSESMRLLGGTTEGGAKRFSAISRDLRTTSSDLYALGFSTKDVNEGLANYTKTLGKMGKLRGMSDAELAKGAKTYLKEMDALAKVTGESRKQQEEAQAKLLADAQYQAAVTNMSATEARKFANTINGLPPGLREVAKDIMVTGTATTEESQQFMALMPKSAAKMAEFAEMSRRGIAPTLEQQQELQNLMKMEGAAAKKQYGDNARYNKDIAKTFMMMNDSANITKDGLTQATAEQAKASEKANNLAAAMEKNKQSLAQLSNGFQLALAETGLLDTMMKGFGLLAELVKNIVVPALNGVSGVLSFFMGIAYEAGGELYKTALTVKDNLKPTFDEIALFVKDTLYPAFLDMAVFVRDELWPILQSMGEVVMAVIVPVLQSLGSVIRDYVWPAFETIGGFIRDNLQPIMATMLTGLIAYTTYQLVTALPALIAFGVGLLAAAAPFLPLVAAVGAIAAGFFFLYKKLEEMGFGFNMLGDAVSLIKIKFKEFVGAMKDLIAKIPGMGRSDEEEAAREEEKKALEEEKKLVLERLTQKREANKAEYDQKNSEEGKLQKVEERKQKRLELQAKIDDRIAGTRAKTAASEAKVADEKKKAELDLSSPTGTLLSFAKQQNSALVKDQSKVSTGTSPAGAAGQKAMAGAETPKTEMVAAADAKAKAAAEKKGSTTGPASTGAGTPTAPAQESAESLLAQLNTKMDQLIKVNNMMHDVGQRQLSVSSNLSQNVFDMV